VTALLGNKYAIEVVSNDIIIASMCRATRCYEIFDAFYAVRTLK